MDVCIVERTRTCGTSIRRKLPGVWTPINVVEGTNRPFSAEMTSFCPILISVFWRYLPFFCNYRGLSGVKNMKIGKLSEHRIFFVQWKKIGWLYLNFLFLIASKCYPAFLYPLSGKRSSVVERSSGDRGVPGSNRPDAIRFFLEQEICPTLLHSTQV